MLIDELDTPTVPGWGGASRTLRRPYGGSCKDTAGRPHPATEGLYGASETGLRVADRVDPVTVAALDRLAVELAEEVGR